MEGILYVLNTTVIIIGAFIIIAIELLKGLEKANKTIVAYAIAVILAEIASIPLLLYKIGVIPGQYFIQVIALWIVLVIVFAFVALKIEKALKKIEKLAKGTNPK